MEVEFVLAGFFEGHGGDVAAAAGVLEDGGAEVFVDEEAGVCGGDAGVEGGFETVVDDRLAVGDVLGSSGGERFVVAEDLGFVGVAVVEGQDVERLGVAGEHVDLGVGVRRGYCSGWLAKT